MNETLRNNYLAAMQIDTWLPRVVLPYAAPSVTATDNNVISDSSVSQPILETVTKEIIVDITVEEKVTIIEPITVEQSYTPEITSATTTSDETPHFSLQLMQAGRCLLLVELPTGSAFQIRDPAYQLLRNILRAAKLPDSPQLLGDIVHWPLFKQIVIPQGRKEAQEFLQSFISTYQEQATDSCCLWLIGLSTIRYTIGLDEQDYYQTPIVDLLGQTLLSPSLELLIDNPQYKANLWQSIRQLIPLWQV
ncbi:energy transducer TonB [Entomomonas asaccharolytica]|uniref:Energy transducer TonB n=1 Tax=Entomomonas asaccharolytica TaxID=2785331 RepID=A0A974RX64_9GAMM|nr:energy transducer TonB [Entomomonas asaccharolytica]QQP85867.1 energy transducer TonB [Entomomonas asaccharolytica]